jgi:hypothetical protein
MKAVFPAEVEFDLVLGRPDIQLTLTRKGINIGVDSGRKAQPARFTPPFVLVGNLTSRGDIYDKILFDWWYS